MIKKREKKHDKIVLLAKSKLSSYSGYGLVFDGKSSSIFNDDFPRNVIIFRVDNSSLSYTHNLKNDFLILDERNTFGINGSFGASEKLDSQEYLIKRV